MAKRKVVAEDLLAIKLVGDPQVSPDGTKCLFTVKTIDAEKNRYLSHLWLADLTDGEVRQFTFGEVSDAAPPVGHLMARKLPSSAQTCGKNGRKFG